MIETPTETEISSPATLSAAERPHLPVRGRSGTKLLLARNVLWNWTGMGVEAVIGFIIAPFLIYKLGSTTYGLWIVLGSMAGYFGILDLGLRSSIGRFVAFHRARNDQLNVNRTVTTSAAILTFVGILAVLGACLLQLVFLRIFDVPPDQIDAARLTLLLIAISFAVGLIGGVFDATLWASQRFDLLNAVDSVCVITRAAATYVLITVGGGLVTLALISLATTVLAAAAKAVLSFSDDRSLRFSPSHVSLQTARTLYGFGLWNFLRSAAQLSSTQLAPIIIGAWLGLAMVTPFTLAKRLLGLTRQFVIAAAAVVTPLATAYHARDEHGRQQALFLEGGRWCTILTLLFGSMLAVLGKPLVLLWVGADLLVTSHLLLILLVGGIIAGSQTLTTRVLIAMAHNHVLTFLAIFEAAIGLPLAVLLIRPLGLYGVCVALAGTSLLFTGTLQLYYGCRVVGVPVGRYVLYSLLMPGAIAILPTAIVAGSVAWHQPTSWVELGTYAAIHGMLYVASFLGYELITQRSDATRLRQGFAVIRSQLFLRR